MYIRYHICEHNSKNLVPCCTFYADRVTNIFFLVVSVVWLICCDMYVSTILYVSTIHVQHQGYNELAIAYLLILNVHSQQKCTLSNRILYFVIKSYFFVLEGHWKIKCVQWLIHNHISCYTWKDLLLCEFLIIKYKPKYTWYTCKHRMYTAENTFRMFRYNL